MGSEGAFWLGAFPAAQVLGAEGKGGVKKTNILLLHLLFMSLVKELSEVLRFTF